MKKILFVITLFIVSCSPPDRDGMERNSNQEETIQEANVQDVLIPYKETPKGISVQIIDSCEYIYCEVTEGVTITHKQNCIFCKERLNPTSNTDFTNY